MLAVPIVLVGCRGERKPTYKQTTDGNFLLTISTNTTSFRRGRSLSVDVTFENISGKELKVVKNSKSPIATLCSMYFS